MKTEFGTNQAVWSWELSKGDRKIIFRNVLDAYDFVYEDPDRIYQNCLSEFRLADFIEYSAYKLDMPDKDKEWFDYMISGYDWNDIRYCIDILDNDVSKEFHEFLIRYNFKIYLNSQLTLA